MATKVIKSIKGRRARITRLNDCGLYVVGSCSKIVTEGFVSVVLTGEWDEGEDFTQKNSWGDYCVSERDEPRLKWVNVAMMFCEVDPDVADFIGGAAVNPVTSGSDTVGFTHGQAPNGAGFAIEVWTKLAGAGCSTLSATITNKALTSNVATLTTSAAHGFVVGQTVVVSAVDATFDGTYTIASTPTGTTFTYAKTAANVVSTAATGTATVATTQEWGYFVVPFVKNGRIDGDVTAGRMATFGARGDGVPALATWALTPYVDNPLMRSGGFPAGDIWGMVRTTVQPPAATAGCAAIA